MFQNIGEMLILFWRTIKALPLTWRQRQKVFDQFFEIGNASLLMVCILSFFIGGVIALQTGPLLVSRGLASAVGGVVGIAICRELAPVMMSILIAGRIGSAMAAEIGSMRVYQEIDALRTMNIDPVHFLVLPRMVAIAVALPMLVIFGILVGWLGGAFVCMANPQILISFAAFLSTLRDVVAASPSAWKRSSHPFHIAACVPLINTPIEDDDGPADPGNKWWSSAATAGADDPLH